MKILRLAIPFLSLPLAAQDMPRPAPELAKLAVLEGGWQGEGTATMAPGAPPTKWNATSTYAWVLGRFWLQGDTAVEFEGMGTMRMREYLGWDGENKRFVALTVGNSGEATLNTLHFDGKEMVQVSHRVRDGRPEVERMRTVVDGDHMDFAISFFATQGESNEAVRGKLHKVAKAELPPIGAARAMMPVAPEMTKIARMAGIYDGKGEMIMAPGTAPMPIAGRDTTTVLFDGGIVMTETKGSEGPPYEAHGFHAWNPTGSCYKIVSIDSMGMICEMDGRLADGAMICTANCLRMGMPCVSRCVVSLDKDGRPVKVVNHSCMGDAPPMQDFSMTYTRVK
ncbi:MAG: DUF1579 family protein [Planctomycetota bacterium]